MQTNGWSLMTFEIGKGKGLLRNAREGRDGAGNPDSIHSWKREDRVPRVSVGNSNTGI
jgi:hypothetical protein